MATRYHYSADLGNTQKSLVEAVMYNLSIGREDERLFTLSKKENSSYLLSSYWENHLPVKTSHKTKMMNIGHDRLMPENEKDWKKEIEWLHSLWNCGRLDFDSKETKTVFFKECKLLGIK